MGRGSSRLDPINHLAVLQVGVAGHRSSITWWTEIYKSLLKYSNSSNCRNFWWCYILCFCNLPGTNPLLGALRLATNSSWERSKTNTACYFALSCLNILPGVPSTLTVYWKANEASTKLVNNGYILGNPCSVDKPRIMLIHSSHADPY